MALTDFLATLEIPWTKGEAPRTDRFNKLLAETRDALEEVLLANGMAQADTALLAVTAPTGGDLR